MEENMVCINHEATPSPYARPSPPPPPTGGKWSDCVLYQQKTLPVLIYRVSLMHRSKRVLLIIVSILVWLVLQKQPLECSLYHSSYIFMIESQILTGPFTIRHSLFLLFAKHAREHSRAGKYSCVVDYHTGYPCVSLLRMRFTMQSWN